MNSTPTAQTHIDQGNAFFTQGKLDQAVLKYKHAIDMDANCSEAYNNWGFTLSALGKLDEACERYSNATRTNPTFSHAYYNWGNALRRQGKFDEAVTKYQKATEIDPKYSLAFNNWGVTLNSQGKLEEAIVQYRKAVQTNPNYSQAYNNWGFALDALGRFDEAIIQFVKATNVDPNYADAYDNWGNALAANGNYVDAIKQFAKAIALNPQNSESYRNWGLALYFQGKFDEAILRYAKATEINPHDVLTYCYWVTALTHIGKSSEAAQVSVRALQILRQHPQAAPELVNQANIELAKGRGKLAASKSENEKTHIHTCMNLIIKTLDLFLKKPIQSPQTPNKVQEQAPRPQVTIAKPVPLVTVEPVKSEPVKEDSPKECSTPTPQADLPTATSLMANSILSNSSSPSKSASPKELSPQGSPERESAEEKLSNSSFLSSASVDSHLTGSPKSPKENSFEQPSSPKEQVQPEESTLFSEPEVQEYYDFLRDELDTLFKKSFVAGEGKLEEKYEALVACINRLAEVVPPLASIPNAEIIFPLVSKMVPDAIRIEDIIQIKRVNKAYKRFISHFTSFEEVEQIIEKLAYEAAVLRKEKLVADAGKNVEKSIVEFAMKGRLLSRMNVASKAEECALLDFGMLVVMCFLEGMKVGNYSSSNEKVEAIVKGLSFKMQVYVEN